jgi:putative transposase
MKYIESRPVDSENFRFSSIQKNLFNKEDSIVTFHNLYKALGYTPQNRIREYSKVFKKAQDSDRAEFIAECLERQSVTGSSSFIKRLEKLVGVSLTPKKRGRPKKEDEQKRKKMYKNLVVLDKEKHSTLKVNPLEDLEFARGSAFIPVVANEVSLIAETFPVVFTSDDEPSLVSIVSLGGDSLAIDANSKWITNYVPTFLRRYPFSLAISSENSEQRVVLIDEDSKLFSRSRGKQLFTKSGEQSETLLHAVEFLTVHDAHSTATKDIIKVISDSGILEDREIAVGEGDEKKILVNGFKVVDREKLNALSDDILGDWVRNGIITMIDAHLKSLDNIENLFKLAQQRQS